MRHSILFNLTSLPPWYFQSAVHYAVDQLNLSEIKAKCMKACLIVGWMSSTNPDWSIILDNTLEVMKYELHL